MRALIGVLAAFVVVAGTGGAASASTSPKQIVSQSTTALRHVRQVTVDWSYRGYKGGGAHGRITVTRTGSHTVSGPSVGHITLASLAKIVSGVTDLSCPRRSGQHLARGANGTFHKIPVMRVVTSKYHELLLLAERTKRPIPLEAILCGNGGPFERAEAGDSTLLFSHYRL